jgi:hypothetical protein
MLEAKSMRGFASETLGWPFILSDIPQANKITATPRHVNKLSPSDRTFPSEAVRLLC